MRSRFLMGTMGCMALASALTVVPFAARAAIVSFDVQGVHVDFDFSPTSLSFGTPVTLSDGTLMQTVTGSNASPASFTFKVVQDSAQGPSWEAYGWYGSDGLTVERFRDPSGGSRLHLTLLSRNMELYYSDVSTLSLDYICALCGDLYDAPLDAGLLSHSPPIKGTATTEWSVPMSAHNPVGGHGINSAVFPQVAVPEPQAWALAAPGLLVALAASWRTRRRRCLISGAPSTGTALEDAASGS